jgi:hypothetical protein
MQSVPGWFSCTIAMLWLLTQAIFANPAAKRANPDSK